MLLLVRVLEVVCGKARSLKVLARSHEHNQLYMSDTYCPKRFNHVAIFDMPIQESGGLSFQNVTIWRRIKTDFILISIDS